MITDLDILRSATVLIRRYGPDAMVHAAMRADELLAIGAVDGALVWERIMRAIERLQVIAPTEGELVH